MDDKISSIIEEMRTGTSQRAERERQQADRSAKKEREAEERAAATRVAAAALDLQQSRDEAWLQTHLGSLNAGQFRQLIREWYGFDPGV
jgi:hypothetical protein